MKWRALHAFFLFPTVIDWERSHGGDAHVGNNSEPAGTFSVLPNPFEYAGIVPGGNQPNSPQSSPHMAGLLTDNAGYVRFTPESAAVQPCAL